MVMKRSRLLFVVGIFTVTVLFFFTGAAPDGVYKIIPGYFADPNRMWTKTPLDEGNESKPYLSEILLEQRTIQRTRHDKQILFGDTHVHTTNSADAFMYSLPMMHGASGAYPPAYACDYARFISQLDFFFLTDHAESFVPKQWRDSIESVRQCNRLAGDPLNPDLVAFIGWEWTQVGGTAETHFGHHNVLFKDDNPELLPTRPIAAAGVGVATVAARSSSARQSALLGLLDPRHRDYYASYNDWIMQMASVPPCELGIRSPDLPPDCFETVATPGQLFGKLDEWGFDNIVVPHGTAWGFYSPPNSNWTHQLTKENHDEQRVGLIEVYSGHGNSEPFRDFAARVKGEEGDWICPEPQENYLPSCWRAGEIIRERCLLEISATEECDARAIRARQNFVNVDGIYGHMTVPGATAADWIDSGQARDVFLPAFNYRPKKSVQYGLAISNLTDPMNPLRNRWGFVASTDTHSARAGHGFKQIHRLHNTDATGVRDPFWGKVFSSTAKLSGYAAESLSADEIDPGAAKLFASEFERATSFLSVGGIAAVHSVGRDRAAIWDAMKRREVYGTSGARILLWFDLIDQEVLHPMGSVVASKSNPTFQVKALGSFKQLPGCPQYVVEQLRRQHLEKMSLGECYHPSEDRYEIIRIEVVKILPQNFHGERVAPLIDDNWRVFDCIPSIDGCVVSFTDAEFVDQGRDAVYYVRALEEPVPTINGKNLRVNFDSNSQSMQSDGCFGDYRIDSSDDCLEMASQRAWSSPIFLDFK